MLLLAIKYQYLNKRVSHSKFKSYNKISVKSNQTFISDFLKNLNVLFRKTRGCFSMTHEIDNTL